MIVIVKKKINIKRRRNMKAIVKIVMKRMILSMKWKWCKCKLKLDKCNNNKNKGYQYQLKLMEVSTKNQNLRPDIFLNQIKPEKG